MFQKSIYLFSFSISILIFTDYNMMQYDVTPVKYEVYSSGPTNVKSH